MASPVSSKAEPPEVNVAYPRAPRSTRFVGPVVDRDLSRLLRPPLSPPILPTGLFKRRGRERGIEKREAGQRRGRRERERERERERPGRRVFRRHQVPGVALPYRDRHGIQSSIARFLSSSTSLLRFELAFWVPSRNAPPSKPWERAGTSSGPAPFRPQSSGRTSEVVEASGTAKPGEVVTGSEINATVNRNTLGRPLPPRPWQQNYGTSHGGFEASCCHTGYGSNLNYNLGYGPGVNGSYGGLGGLYSGGFYGNSMYTGNVGIYGGSGMYGGSMYNGGYGGSLGGYGMGMGGPFGNQNPDDPYSPPSPPGFWISLIRVLFDRSGLLYGELARFVLRILGIRRRSRKQQQLRSGEGPGNDGHEQRFIEGPKDPTGSWDCVWGDDVKGAH
ncbi:hypothetical protein GW17_00019548 [Ensete ventricosum]|nr:hypothetical protein GW17_00019548 [Ensete ventricosum]